MRLLPTVIGIFAILAVVAAQQEAPAQAAPSVSSSAQHEELLSNLKALHRAQQDLLGRVPEAADIAQAVKQSIPAPAAPANTGKEAVDAVHDSHAKVQTELKSHAEHLTALKAQQEAAASRLESSLGALNKLLERVTADLATLSQSTSQHTTGLKHSTDKADETHKRLDKIDGQVSHLKTLIETLAEKAQSDKKDTTGPSIHSVLDSQSKIYQLLHDLRERHNASVMHQTKEAVVAFATKVYHVALDKSQSFFRLATSFAKKQSGQAAVLLGGLFSNSSAQATESVTHVYQNFGPLARQYYAQGRLHALETHKKLSGLAAQYGVPHEHAQLAAAIGLFLAVLFGAFLGLWLLLAVCRAVCCCRRSKSATKGQPVKAGKKGSPSVPADKEAASSGKARKKNA